jgi:hypothetical protein
MRWCTELKTEASAGACVPASGSVPCGWASACQLSGRRGHPRVDEPALPADSAVALRRKPGSTDTGKSSAGNESAMFQVHPWIRNTKIVARGCVIMAVNEDRLVHSCSELSPGDEIEAWRAGRLIHRGRVSYTLPSMGMVWIIDARNGTRSLLDLEDLEVARLTHSPAVVDPPNGRRAEPDRAA